MSKPSSFEESLLSATEENALLAIERVGERFPELIRAWVEARNASALLAVAEGHQGKARKEAKRGLSVLKARQVPIEQPARQAFWSAREQKGLEEAWLVPPDASGLVVLCLAKKSATRPSQAAFVVLHEGVGIRRIEGGSFSSSQLKESLTRALPTREARAVQVPIEWARWRISSAYRQNQASKVPVPLGWTTFQELFQPAPEEEPPHPFDGEGLELSDEDARILAGSSVSLHSVPEFRAWFPSQQAVHELLQRVGEKLQPGAQPEEDQLRKQIEEETLLATDRYFSEERRADVARLMKDAGLSVLERDGEARALELSAVIQRMGQAGLITDPPHEIGFLKGFFEKALALMLAQNQGHLQIPVAQNRGAEGSGNPPLGEPEQRASQGDAP